MVTPESLKAQIEEVFDRVDFPGDWCLRGSNEGNEPFLVEEEFRGKDDWRTLDPQFLDQTPAGYATALSFFSDEAFRFYLPAYLLADVDGRLKRVDVLFHLCHGLDDESRHDRVNPRRYGDRTWFDRARYRFSVFSGAEAKAIVGYLQHKFLNCDLVDSDKEMISQALHNYWLQRASE